MEKWQKRLVSFLAIFLVALGAGIFVSSSIKDKHNYTNPIFGYSLVVSPQYSMQKQNDRQTDPKRKSDFACLATQRDGVCILAIDSYQNIDKLSLDSFLKNQPKGPEFPSRVTIGQYSAATWLDKSNINYVLVNSNMIMHIYFSTESAQMVKDILKTIKL